MRAAPVIIDWRNTRVERELVANGFHPSGQWWADLIERYLIEGPRIVVIRAGRRAGKTVHVIRAMLNDVFSRAWKIDPGDMGIAKCSLKSNVGKKNRTNCYSSANMKQYQCLPMVRTGCLVYC